MRDEIALALAAMLLVLCVWGIRAQAYRDNWLQLAGMSLTTLAALMIGWHAWTTERTSTRVVVLLLGAVLYGAGTAYKVWQHRRHSAAPPAAPPADPPAPYKLEPADMQRVAGGRKP